MTTETFEYNGKTHTLTVVEDTKHSTCYNCQDFPGFEFFYYKGDNRHNPGWDASYMDYFDNSSSGLSSDLRDSLPEALDVLYERVGEIIAFYNKMMSAIKPNKAD